MDANKKLDMKQLKLLKDTLLEQVKEHQNYSESAGMHYSRRKVNLDHEVLDQLARMLALVTDSTCAAAYVDSEDSKIVLAINGKEIPANMNEIYINLINDCIDRKEKIYAVYLRRLMEHCDDGNLKLTINGYSSYDEFTELLNTFEEDAYKYTLKDVRNALHNQLEKLVPLINDFCQKIKADTTQLDSPPVIEFLALGIQLIYCSIEFEVWKKELQENKKEFKNYRFEEIVKLAYPNLHTCLKEIKKMVHNLKRVVSDVNKLSYFFENRNMKNTYTKFEMITPLSKEIYIHAEAKVMMYLYNKKKVPILCKKDEIWLAVSKLACPLCYAMSLACEGISVRGFHEKQYPRWDFPKGISLDLAAKTLSKFAELYQSGYLLGYPFLKDTSSSVTSDASYTSLSSNCEIDLKLTLDDVKDLILFLINLQKEYPEIVLFNYSLTIEIDKTKYSPEDICRELDNEELKAALSDFKNYLNR